MYVTTRMNNTFGEYANELPSNVMCILSVNNANTNCLDMPIKNEDTVYPTVHGITVPIGKIKSTLIIA